ncbi:MAG: hypothetical protein ACI30H_06330 [Paludibacteraceae bacterium]
MKRITFLIAAVTISVANMAQDSDSTLTHSVDIAKEFTPQIVKVKRADIELPSTEPQVEKSAVVYSSEAETMNVQSQFYPLPPTDAKNTGRPTYKPGYACIGIGFPLVWQADAWTPIVNNKTDKLEVELSHYGIWNGTKKLIQTDFDLNYTRAMKYRSLYANIGFSNDYFSYFGNDSVFDESTYYRADLNRDIAGVGLSPQTRTTTAAHAIIGFGSNTERKGWTYNGHVSYDFMTSFPTITKDYVAVRQASQREHNIGLHLFGGYNINGHHINADLDFAAYVYNTPAQSIYLIDSITPTHKRILHDSTFVDATWKPQFLIAFNPRYEKSWKNVSLRAGAKLWFSINKGNVVAAAPDIEARYKFRDIFDLYGGIGGDYQFTSLQSMLDENRYYDPRTHAAQNDYTPCDLHLGFNVKPVHNFSIDAFVSYQFISNTHFFRNRVYACTATPNVFPKTDLEYVYGNTFTAVDAQARLLTAELRLMYNIKERYNFHVKGKYNGWQVLTEGVEAWNKPAWEADAGIEALFTKNFAGNVNFYYASSRTAQLPRQEGGTRLVTLAPIYDLNASLSYTFPKNWTLWLQANNLLALSKELRYQDWYGYDNIGFNILIGLSVAF